MNQKDKASLQKRKKDEYDAMSVKSKQKLIKRQMKYTKANSKQRFEGIASVHNFTEVDLYSVGQMNVVCDYCGALGFKGEIQSSKKEVVHFGNLCCQQGKVNVPLFENLELDSYLVHLLTSENKDAVYFRSHSRMFNAGMAMASMVDDKQRKSNNNRSSAYFVSGELKRCIGPIMPTEGKTPKCIQTYFFEPDDATAYRIKNFEDLKPSEKALAESIFTGLHKALLRSKHQYLESCYGVKTYIEQNYPNGIDSLRIAIHAEVSPDENIHKGRLNKAVAIHEVSILLDEDLFDSKERQVVLNLKEPENDDYHGIRRIPDYHRSYDPLQYPLFFNK
jgi:hypothetical protein